MMRDEREDGKEIEGEEREEKKDRKRKVDESACEALPGSSIKNPSSTPHNAQPYCSWHCSPPHLLFAAALVARLRCSPRCLKAIFKQLYQVGSYFPAKNVR